MKFDAEWAYCEIIPTENEPWACIRKEDVKKLRELLYQCQQQQKSKGQ